MSDLVQESDIQSSPLAQYKQDAKRFDFFRLLYLLERLAPNDARLGYTGPVRDETIRLRTDPALVFASSDIVGFETVRGPDRVERTNVTASFLGLVGAASPLPTHFVESVALAVHQDQPQVVRELLDVIHHRLYSLVYRAWSKYRHAFAYQSEGKDDFTRRMFCAVGIDGFSKHNLPLNPFYFLRFAPLLAGKSRSARGLSIVLDQLLGGIDVDIEQFVGHWTKIEKPLRNKLGVANHQLGESMVLGRYVYDGSGRFAVKLGPLQYDDYISFLPGGHRRPFMQKIINTFTPGIHDVMLELHVDLESAPRFQLGSPRSSTLSRTCWLGGSQRKNFTVTVPLDDSKVEKNDDDDDHSEPPPIP
jgi:type VI secretion system protein ImpH